MRRNFEANTTTIRSGMHRSLLAWAAGVYFCLFLGLDENATPRERLVELLGETNTDIVIEGFIASLQRPDVPTLESVAETSADHQIYNWWRALIAGLDERWRLIPSLDGLSDDLLRAVLAIEQANPTFVRGSERRQHDWKTAVLQTRPQLGLNAY